MTWPDPVAFVPVTQLDPTQLLSIVKQILDTGLSGSPIFPQYHLVYFLPASPFTRAKDAIVMMAWNYPGIRLPKQCCCVEQEGQHPLTGQCAANFRLLANQWAERRLVTQWRHGCRAMRWSVVGPFAFRYQGNGATPCQYIDTTRKAIDCATTLPLRAWEFLYNETLQQTFRSLLSKLSKRRQI